MQTILLAGVIIECIFLLVLAALKKCTRRIFICISLITAMCCGFVAFACREYGAQDTRGADKIKGYIYMAIRLLEREQTEDALSALGQITGAEGEAYGAQGLRGLAYNQSGAYSAGAYLLENASDPVYLELQDSCEKKELRSDALFQEIIQDCLEKLSLSEAEMARYDAELAIRYGNEERPAKESDAWLLQVKSAVNHEEYENAYRFASENAMKGTIADNILVSEMFIRNFNQQNLSREDEAFDALLKEVTDIQVKLNRLAAENGTDGREYEDCSNQYQLALQELEIESAKRAVNYLSSSYTEGSIYDFAYCLQMSKLLLRTGAEDEAEAYLNRIFLNKNLDHSQWLAVEIEMLKEAFLDGMGNIDVPEFDALYAQLINGLYQGIFDDTDAGTDAQSGYYSFLRSYLQKIYSGIYIGRPDISKFPAITVSVSTSAEIALSPDTVTLLDTKESISDFTVEEKNDTSMSICFVLDRSGSMSGSYMASAQQAIKGFATKMDTNTAAALVSFESSARVDCPLVDSSYMIAAQVEKINASGGTNISSGLLYGAEQLYSANGKKVIILLSDGYDGNSSTMPATLNQLKMAGIIVYVIGLPGCDEQYLTNIAAETGGTYFPANDATALNHIYDQIRGLLRNSYAVTYQVTHAEETERTIWIESVDSMAQSRRPYTTLVTTEQYSQIHDIQTSNLFKQIGGSMGGY